MSNFLSVTWKDQLHANNLPRFKFRKLCKMYENFKNQEQLV
jgi:hypothetical protein